jgi:hypothetical protein
MDDAARLSDAQLCGTSPAQSRQKSLNPFGAKAL